MKLTRKQRWGVLYWGIVALGESLAILGALQQNTGLFLGALGATIVTCLLLGLVMAVRGVR